MLQNRVETKNVIFGFFCYIGYKYSRTVFIFSIAGKFINFLMNLYAIYALNVRESRMKMFPVFSKNQD